MSDELDALTAFLIIRREDGSYFATTDLTTVVTVAREATRTEVKYGCADILDAIKNTDLINRLIDRLPSNTPAECEKTASSIRQALEERGIL